MGCSASAEWKEESREPHLVGMMLHTCEENFLTTGSGLAHQSEVKIRAFGGEYIYKTREDSLLTVRLEEEKSSKKGHMYSVNIQGPVSAEKN